MILLKFKPVFILLKEKPPYTWLTKSNHISDKYLKHKITIKHLTLFGMCHVTIWLYSTRKANKLNRMCFHIFCVCLKKNVMSSCVKHDKLTLMMSMQESSNSLQRSGVWINNASIIALYIKQMSCFLSVFISLFHRAIHL